jgi:anti-sigma regulatory factor (Ser/Thr protein kinase)
VKNSSIPINLDIDNKRFAVILAKSPQNIYGVLGIEMGKADGGILFVETISQLKFLSSLISIVLERFELEEVNKYLLVSEEQNRIAREIHDSVCQRIFATGCKIHMLKQKCDGVSFEELRKDLDFIEQSLNKANKELRTTIYDLSWKNEKRTAFQEEIESYIRDIARLNSVNISFNMTGNQEIVENDLKKAVYRIISEAIGNAVRHGKCSKVGVLLNIQKESVELDITDDGVGFDLNKGTLPVEINYETFQSISEINIAGLSMKIKVYIDVPPSELLNGAFENQYVMPGHRCYGRVSIEVPNGGKSINYIADNTADLSNVESLDISSNSDVAKEKVVTVCTKEMQSVPVSIPIGCGIWEDTLVLNVNVNVNITTHVKVPIVDALPGIVTEDSRNSQIFEQNETLSPSIDNIVNDSIIDEKEAGSVIENEQSNVENSTVDENITSEGSAN